MSALNRLFVVESGRLIVSNATTGEICWAGEPLGTPVKDVKTVPGSDQAVVLLDYMAMPSSPSRNLICVGPDGTVVWTAPLPSASSTDAYVSFDLGVGEVHANSWSGYQALIDLSSGEIRRRTFTK